MSAHRHTYSQLRLHVYTISRAYLFHFIFKEHMQKSTGAYGAHFCTSCLMLLSSLFVLSIIVLREGGGQSRAVSACCCFTVESRTLLLLCLSSPNSLYPEIADRHVVRNSCGAFGGGNQTRNFTSAILLIR